MALKKVSVDMDDYYVVYIPYENPDLPSSSYHKKIELDEQWLEEFQAVTKRYREMQVVLVHLYRKEVGLYPYTQSEEEKQELQRATQNVNKGE